MSPREQSSEVSPLEAASLQVMEANWRPPGFTCPNPTTYPWLWLWDSCFHSIIWAALGAADRAVSELNLVLSVQHDDGFVPHLLYLDGFRGHESFWWSDAQQPTGSVPTSSITQPPVYGHTVAELSRCGVRVEPDVLRRAKAGLDFLLGVRRRSSAGLIEVVHPWESGCDDSPRWDDVTFAGLDEVPRLDPPAELLFERKGTLLETVQHSSAGSPVANDDFAVGSVAFSAITAWAAAELGSVTEDPALLSAADELGEAISTQWEPQLSTWVDDGPSSQGSGRVRTAEALLPILLPQPAEVVDAVVEQLTSADAFGGEYGPAQVHREEPSFSRGSYWRGPSWPQLDYLLWRGLSRHAADSERAAHAARLVAAGTRRGALRSGFSEYWDHDDGEGGGARPQSWATLALLTDPDVVS